MPPHALNADNPWIRLMAAHALEEAAAIEPTARHALQKATNSDDTYVAWVARHAVQTVPDRSSPRTG